MRTGDLGSGIYKNQAALEDQIKTAEVHHKKVEAAIELCQAKIREFTDIVTNLKSQIEYAKDAITKGESNAKTDIAPLVKKILDEFEQKKNYQNQVNSKLQNQIIELKKEKAELVQNIINCKKKVDELQKDLGRYPGDKGMTSKFPRNHSMNN